MNAVKRFVRCCGPTALCEAHERIHRDRPFGAEARAALRALRWWRPLLCLLPTTGNIRIRHLLTVAGLRAEVFRADRFQAYREALKFFRRCTDGGLVPHIEGWSYARYIGLGVEYTLGAGIPCREFVAAMAGQEALARRRAMPSGVVPDHDTRMTDLVEPGTEEFYSCDAFTVSRRGGRYIMVQHDARIRSWRFRWNFHVGNSFGVVVREEADWPFWYNGWENKRIRWTDIAWRFWPPRMEVLECTTERVRLRIGRKEKTILLHA